MTLRQKFSLILLSLGGDANACSLIRWRLGRCDHLLYDHALAPGSVIYDVGGYRGDWTAGILAKHSCECHVFEPHPEAFKGLQSRFAGRPGVHLHEFALGRDNGRVALSSDEEGSSIVSPREGQTLEVQLVDVCEFLGEHGCRVALMKLNIEGAEYELLENLLWSSLRDRVGSLLIQFHSGAPDAMERYDAIEHELRKTHALAWRYPFLWELWRPKSGEFTPDHPKP